MHITNANISKCLSACAQFLRCNFARFATLLAVMSITLILAAPSAQAQFIFSGNATGGTFDYDDDGIADGTWTISNSGQNSANVFFPSEGGVGFQYTVNGDLTSVFNAVPNDPEVTYQLTLFGNNGSGTFGSAFDSYTLSWTGGSGQAQVVDPDTEIENISTTTNSITFEQVPNGNSVPVNSSNGQNCNLGNSVGAIRNDCLDWSVNLPFGASNLTLLAENGAAGGRFFVSVLFLLRIFRSQKPYLIQIFLSATVGFTRSQSKMRVSLGNQRRLQIRSLIYCPLV